MLVRHAIMMFGDRLLTYVSREDDTNVQSRVHIRDGLTLRWHESKASFTGRIKRSVMRMTQDQSRRDVASHKYIHCSGNGQTPTSMFTICSMDLQQLILTLQTLICLLQLVQNITRPITTLHFLNTTHLAPQHLDTRARGMCMARQTCNCSIAGAQTTCVVNGFSTARDACGNNFAFMPSATTSGVSVRCPTSSVGCTVPSCDESVDRASMREL